MSEANTEATTGGEAKQDTAGQEQSSSGRYIPYGGGCMGWFENSGVLKSELGNNYRFSDALDMGDVRRRLFDRWGDNINRRSDERQNVEKDVSVKVIWADNSVAGLTKDVSSNGLRMQFLVEAKLVKGDTVTVEILEAGPESEVKFKLPSQIMWVNRVGRRRPVWNIGISFTEIDREIDLKLKEFLIA